MKGKERMNDLIERVKTKSLDCWSRLVKNASEADDLADMASFVFLFGVLLLTGFGVVFLLGTILIHAPWIFLAFFVSFGIPAGFLAWVKMKDKSEKDNYDNDGM